MNSTFSVSERFLLREYEYAITAREDMTEPPLDYATSGVDIDLEAEAVSSLIDSIKSSARLPGELGHLSDFQGVLVELLSLGTRAWFWLLTESVQSCK